MRYIDKVLQPGEQLLYSSKLHWMIYFPPVFLLIIAIGIFGFALSVDRDTAGIVFLAGAISVVLALFMFVAAWVERWTTEIEVTDRRVVYKRGLIRRETVEMNMDKVESVDVNQSILGRVFDYGDVIVRGTGVGWKPLRKIDAPLTFRNHIIAR